MRRAGFPPIRCGWVSRYFFRRRVRRQLAAEIRAQFTAFAATGLTLDHANAHKHMHLHPTVGALMLRIGRDFGLRSVRVPAEPPAVLARCGTRLAGATARCTGGRGCCGARCVRRRSSTSDHCFGIAGSGHMTADRVRCLLRELPDGASEIYFHPATGRDAELCRLMPDYEHEAELAALLDPGIAAFLTNDPQAILVIFHECGKAEKRSAFRRGEGGGMRCVFPHYVRYRVSRPPRSLSRDPQHNRHRTVIGQPVLPFVAALLIRQHPQCRNLHPIPRRTAGDDVVDERLECPSRGLNAPPSPAPAAPHGVAPPKAGPCRPCGG